MARERALELLYEAEVKATDTATVIAELPIAPDPYTVALCEGFDARAADVDALISAHLASGWSFERLAAVDRAILRFAIIELETQPQAPTAVVLSEAVELAKEYSTDDSARFVNGVLAAVAGEIRGG